jgi:hypothetical protein
MTCAGCGIGINIDTDGLTKATEEIRKAIEKVPPEITIKFFRSHEPVRLESFSDGSVRYPPRSAVDWLATPNSRVRMRSVSRSRLRNQKICLDKIPR